MGCQEDFCKENGYWLSLYMLGVSSPYLSSQSEPLMSPSTLIIARSFGLVFTAWLATASCLATAETARGVVFNDQNGNGVHDTGELGLAGVPVSNGQDIVKTDMVGNYQLSVNSDTTLFVIKPRDWQTRLDEKNLPRFYYIHKPEGSPDEGFNYPGVEPTGPLPASIDFPLTSAPDPEQFTVILMGDPQPYTLQEVRFYANDVVAELVDTTALLGMSLGDIVGDDLSLFDAVNNVQGLVGVPWYNVLGNHDINHRSPDDEHSDESFERVYGPPNYAFQYGQVHFIVLDNVYWMGPKHKDEAGNEQGGYEGRLTKRQLEFTRNYLQLVSKNDLVIVCTHIPLPELGMLGSQYSTAQYRLLLEILSSHSHTLSFSAHTHVNTHVFSGSEKGYSPTAETEHHHHNVATGSGSWYRGPINEQGFPVTTMADGAPNGYILATFRGNEYRLRYKGARMPVDYQMAIHAPEVICSNCDQPDEVLVNVFNGNERSRVRMRVRGQGDWTTMEQSPRPDPVYAAAQQRDVVAAGTDRHALPKAKVTTHMWVAKLPNGLPVGMHVLEVEATDMFDQTDRGIRIIEVE